MSQRNSLSDEDIALFRESLDGVRPLPDDNRAERASRRPPPRARFRRADEEAVKEASLAGDWEELPETGEVLQYARPGIRRDVLRRLRRGRIPVRDELDLHGLNWRDARLCVAVFLAECQARDIRCVRLIHGKGLRSGNNGPVIKTRLNSYLQKRSDVIAFCSARQNDGGTGAMYVLVGGG